MTLVGMVFLTSGLISAVTQMIGGYLADRYGRKRVILISMSLNILSNTGMTALILSSAPVMIILAVYVLAQSVTCYYQINPPTHNPCTTWFRMNQS